MGDINEVVSDAVDKAKESESRLNTAVAVLVSISATFMALCNVKDGNIVQAMAQSQANAVDAWAFFQSKSTKQHMAESIIDQLTIQRDVTGQSLTPEGRALIEKKIAEYQARAKQYEVEKAEIKKQAEGYQKQYDALNVHDDQFDMAEASLSIAIALFGVTALTKKRWMLLVAGSFALFGTVLGLAGFLGKGLHPDFLAKLLG
jgi:DNA repair ATPase RecN